MTLITVAAQPAMNPGGHMSGIASPIMTRVAEAMEPAARRFVRSDFAGDAHRDWPLGSRLSAYLLSHGIDLTDDPMIYHALLEQISAGLDSRVGAD
jgi:hypothetical protein